MSANPPVKFSDKIKETSADGSGYPYRIKADDLDKNFVFATLDVPKGWVEETTGSGGHKQRKLAVPVTEYYVVINGSLYTQEFLVAGTPEPVV
jgi:hypothetical protein